MLCKLLFNTEYFLRVLKDDRRALRKLYCCCNIYLIRGVSSGLPVVCAVEWQSAEKWAREITVEANSHYKAIYQNVPHTVLGLGNDEQGSAERPTL